MLLLLLLLPKGPTATTTTTCHHHHHHHHHSPRHHHHHHHHHRYDSLISSLSFLLSEPPWRHHLSGQPRRNDRNDLVAYRTWIRSRTCACFLSVFPFITSAFPPSPLRIVNAHPPRRRRCLHPSALPFGASSSSSLLAFAILNVASPDTLLAAPHRIGGASCRLQTRPHHPPPPHTTVVDQVEVR